MKLTRHLYQDEDDYWQIREFLRQVFLLNDRREQSWHVARFDYWRWHGVENMGHGRLEEDVFIWEMADARVPSSPIAAVLTRESPGDVFLQIHPGLRTPELEDEMVAVAEQHLAIIGPDGQRKLCVWANEHDEALRNVLTRRGYTPSGGPEHQHRRALSRPIPDVPVAEGYTVRALGDVKELPARSWASWKAFHPNAPDEDYDGWEWYHNIQRAPLYRRDLDLVAVASNGEVASFCTIWYDDVTRSAYFEPVGTQPAHQRRGLGKAVMFEGLRRLKRMGATMAFVGGYSPAANALYGSLGTEQDLLEPWEKRL